MGDARLGPDPDAGTAKRTLFLLGQELPGCALRRFAKRLLIATREHPDAASQDLVEREVSAIEGGVVALVAVEPDLYDAPLDPPAATVREGATAVVTALGHDLVAAYRRL